MDASRTDALRNAGRPPAVGAGVAARRLPVVDLRRAADRARTRTDWLDSRHSFAFGQHYDPTNTSYGVLLAHNEDVVRAGAGFDDHHHREVEIVTWVLRGALVHQDAAGHRGVVRPGVVQRMSAGSGVVHSERNDAGRRDPECDAEDDLHLVQMWIAPDSAGGDPDYEQGELDDAALRGGLVAVASGRADRGAAVRIGNRDAVLLAARLELGQSVALPDAPFLHLFVAVGAVDVAGGALDVTGGSVDLTGGAVGDVVDLQAGNGVALWAGDAARLTGAGGPVVTATAQAEVLVWEMYATLD